MQHDYAISKLEDAGQNVGYCQTEAKLLNDAIAILRDKNKGTIDDSTALAIKEKYLRNEAVIMLVRDASIEDSPVTGASFSIIHRGGDGSAAAGMYTYEALPEDAPDAVKSRLLRTSVDVIHEKIAKSSPVFFEGDSEGGTLEEKIKKRAEQEAKGLRTIKYDTKDYKWCDDDYKWMVYGDAAPSLNEMKTAIQLQRSFVVLSELPKEVSLDKPLAQQMTSSLRQDFYYDGDKKLKGYGLDKSIAHAETMAREAGGDKKMELEAPLWQTVNRRPNPTIVINISIRGR